MLLARQYEDTNLLELTIDGEISRQEFDNVTTIMKTMFLQFGKIRLLEIVKDVGRISPSTLWEDLKFGPKHLKHFSHVAVVADKKWVEWATSMSKPFLSAEVKTFHLDQLDEARSWIWTVEQPH